MRCNVGIGSDLDHERQRPSTSGCDCWCFAASGHASTLEEVLSILTSDARGQKDSEARRLLHKKALNQQASKGRTPLMLACETGCVHKLQCIHGRSCGCLLLPDVNLICHDAGMHPVPSI